MRAIRMFAFLFAVAPVIAHAQTKVLPATKIPAADIQERMRPRKAGELPNMRVLDSGGHNVGIGVLHRTQEQKQNTAVHFKVSEVYHIMKGSGTLVTGGTVVNPKTRAADSVEVSREDGPGVTGTAIQGGVNNELKEGDVIVIPAGTPHWFSELDGDITYMIVRTDPANELALK